MSESNVVVDNLITESYYYPSSILTFYSNSKNQHYIEAASVMLVNGNYIAKAAKPLDNTTIRALAASLKANKRALITTSTTEFLPQNLLFIEQSESSETIVWYEPPCKKLMKFTDSADHKLKTGVRNIPGLVYIYRNDDLFLFAYKGKGRPTPATVIYCAPFYNIYEDGRICMGTVQKRQIRKSYYSDLIKAWESKFWNSYFTDEERGERSTIPLKKLWRKLNQPFDSKVLVREGKSLKTIIERL